MTTPSNRRYKRLWPILILLLLAVRSAAVPREGSPPGRAHQPGAAGAVHKPAWQWTTEERLAKLLDPEERASRIREHVEEQKAIRALQPPSDDPLFNIDYDAHPPGDVIDGNKTPELFLPSQLFTFLLDAGLPANGQVEWARRGLIEQRAAALGFGQGLWPRLEKAAAPFLELKREAERLRISHHYSLADLKKDSEARRWCRTRAQAISAAKSEFGEEPFLRLLYEAVAPDTHVFFAPNQDLDFEYLRYMEEGCQ